jgi:hypothetical protein
VCVLVCYQLASSSLGSCLRPHAVRGLPELAQTRALAGVPEQRAGGRARGTAPRGAPPEEGAPGQEGVGRGRGGCGRFYSLPGAAVGALHLCFRTLRRAENTPHTLTRPAHAPARPRAPSTRHAVRLASCLHLASPASNPLPPTRTHTIRAPSTRAATLCASPRAYTCWRSACCQTRHSGAASRSRRSRSRTVGRALVRVV